MQKQKPLSAVNKFAIALSTFLIIEGAWGLASDVVLWVLTTNVLHASIHLLLGFTGLYAALRNHARKFSLYVGLLLLVVGILYFIPSTADFVIDLLNVNREVSVLNIIIGITAILFAVLTPKHQIAHPAHAHR